MRKSIILFLLILVFVSPLLSVYGETELDDKQIDDLVENAQKLLEQGKNTEALEVFDVLLANFPEYADVYKDKILVQIPNTDSKYQGYAQIEVRNSDGWLVGFVEKSTFRYVPITVDAYLDKFEIVEMVENNGKTFEKRIIVNEKIKEETSYLGNVILLLIRNNNTMSAFAFTSPGLLIESGDTVLITFTILREVT